MRRKVASPQALLALTAALGLALVTTSRIARAAGPLGPQGTPITTSAYNVDLFQGPVLASSRITGLAGAYTPLADGSDGNPWNPASPALRLPYAVEPSDFDVTAGITFPATVRGVDFYNSGSKGFTYKNFLFITAGANLQYAHWGVGASLDIQTYNLGQPSGFTGYQSLQLTLLTGHLLGAYGFFDDQLVVGAGARVVSFGADGNGADPATTLAGSASGTTNSLLKMSGIGAELGVVWAPHPLPVRLGVALRGPVEGRAEGNVSDANVTHRDGDTIIGTTMYIPDRIVMPWQIDVGFAFQLGPRPLNLRWNDRRDVPDDAVEAERAASPRPEGAKPETRKEIEKRILHRRYDAVPRHKLLVTTSLLVTGPTADAVGFESFLQQNIDRSGRVATVTPRLGVEGEPIASWLQLRAGTYYEPTRFTGPAAHARLHGTFGFDAKLFNWSVFGLYDDWTYWRIGGVIDGARDYFGWGLSIGVWH